MDRPLYHQYGDLFPGDNITGYMASAVKTGQIGRFEAALAICVREKRPMREVYDNPAVTKAMRGKAKH
ncbi:MAG: hypothetical protein LUO80_03680 [Methylococcaceae bacterium]|nr:hypothetical protein [Methylococcaceae bacterium]